MPSSVGIWKMEGKSVVAEKKKKLLSSWLFVFSSPGPLPATQIVTLSTWQQLKQCQIHTCPSLPHWTVVCQESSGYLRSNISQLHVCRWWRGSEKWRTHPCHEIICSSGHIWAGSHDILSDDLEIFAPLSLHFNYSCMTRKLSYLWVRSWEKPCSPDREWFLVEGLQFPALFCRWPRAEGRWWVWAGRGDVSLGSLWPHCLGGDGQNTALLLAGRAGWSGKAVDTQHNCCLQWAVMEREESLPGVLLDFHSTGRGWRKEEFSGC